MPDDVQITVTKVIRPTAHGILVAGHVDRGAVHARDIFQAQNAQPGATARVGRIYQGRKKIQEAQAGSDVRLLLERIEEREIHPGDRLLPGQKKDLRPAPKKYLLPIDDKLWGKLPERIEPILHPRQLAVKIALLAFLGIFWAIGIHILMSAVDSPGSDPLFLIFWFGFVGYFTYNAIRALIYGLRGRSRFVNGQSKTVAQILRCKAVENGSDYGPAYTYYVQVEFAPGMAEAGTGTVRWKAQVSKRIYESLEGNTTVNVTYAIDDPRIFVLEGE